MGCGLSRDLVVINATITNRWSSAGNAESSTAGHSVAAARILLQPRACCSFDLPQHEISTRGQSQAISERVGFVACVKASAALAKKCSTEGSEIRPGPCKHGMMAAWMPLEGSHGRTAIFTCLTSVLRA